MADAKISQLPVATTPLAGTELVPVVQGGVTDQTTVEAILTGTVPSGTANGVLYLNGSKVVTSGSALTFDTARLSFIKASNGRAWSADGDDLFAIENSTSANADFRTSTTGATYLMFSDTDARARGYVAYLHGSDSMPFAAAGTEQMRLTSTGLGIGTSSPAEKLDTNGNIRVTGASNERSIGFNFYGVSQYNFYVDGSSDSARMAIRRGTTEVAAFDSSGNLGIGTSSPGVRLEVAGSIRSSSSIFAGYASGFDQTYIGSNGATGNGCVMATVNYANNAYQPISYDASVYLWRPNGTEAMRLDSTGLGIGTSSPSRKLDVQGAPVGVGGAGTGVLANFVNNTTAFNASPTAAISLWNRINTAGSTFPSAVVQAGKENATDGNYAGYLSLQTTDAAGVSTERMRLDSSGNLGLGVSPSAWSVRTIQVPNNYAFGHLGYSNNAFYDGAWKYLTTAAAATYQQTGGQHTWYTAPSGTAGNAISFTQAMTLDASGNLGIGTTNPSSFGFLAVHKGQTADTAIVVGNDGTSNPATTMSFVLSEAGAKQGWFRRYRDGSGNTEIGFSDALLFTGSVTGTKAERARITSGGDLLVGTASNTGYGGSVISKSAADVNPLAILNTSATNPYGIAIDFTGAAPNDTTRYFLTCSDTGGERATIRSNGGLANYQSNDVDLSDARTKKDITPAPSYWSKIGALEIVTYKYKDQTHDDINVGVIAQQVEQVEPVWVDADGFGETPEGEEPLKTVYTKDITFAAIKALQEAMIRIEQLEGRLAAAGI